MRLPVPGVQLLTLQALLLTPRTKVWLQRRTIATVLHVFDQACNLVDPEGQIISLVSAELGPGPFAIVIPLPTSFTRFVRDDTPISVIDAKLCLGSVTVETAQASLWQPGLPWARLQERPERLQKALPVLKTYSVDHPRILANAFADQGHQRFVTAAELLFAGLADHDWDASRQGAAGLAGLGEGLTPAGDDFLVGVIYALWATGTAGEVIDNLVEAAVGRTTSLSAAWLQAAGRGEAAKPWHELMQAINENDAMAVERALQRIAAIGHSSGGDALAGFTAGLAQGI
jgi:hypothetical protein